MSLITGPIVLATAHRRRGSLAALGATHRRTTDAAKAAKARLASREGPSYDDSVAGIPRSQLRVLLAGTTLAVWSPATWAQVPVTAPVAAPAEDGNVATPTALAAPTAGSLPVPPSVSPATETALPVVPKLPANRVRVRIVADQPIELWAKEAGSPQRSVYAGYQDAQLTLPLADVYTVTGPQIPSQTFSLRALPNLRVDVSVGSKGGQVGGVILIAVGGLGVLTGAVALLIGVGNAGLISFLGGSRMDALTPFWTVGAIGLLAGTPLVGGGIALLLRSRTRVRQSSTAN